MPRVPSLLSKYHPPLRLYSRPCIISAVPCQSSGALKIPAPPAFSLKPPANPEMPVGPFSPVSTGPLNPPNALGQGSVTTSCYGQVAAVTSGRIIAPYACCFFSPFKGFFCFTAVLAEDIKNKSLVSYSRPSFTVVSYRK